MGCTGGKVLEVVPSLLRVNWEKSTGGCSELAKHVAGEEISFSSTVVRR